MPSRSLAKVRARSHLVLIAAILASIAAARRNFRRPRDTSRQTRSQERSSREENRSSLLPLKADRPSLTAFRICIEAETISAAVKGLEMVSGTGRYLPQPNVNI